MKTTDEFLSSAMYLPPILRDFHDQKDIFRAMHEIINVEGHDYAKKVGWISGQCYVIDIFLRFMACRGYTLQRSRVKCDFRDLHGDVEAANKKRQEHMTNLLIEAMK